jgi:hypothetical protein
MPEATRDSAVDSRMRFATAASAMVALVMAVAVTGAGCSRRGKGSAACTDIAGAACQDCRTTAKAPFCDAKYVAPQASENIAVNGLKSCCGFEDPKLRAQCESVLTCIRTTGCAVGNNPSRCLCGDVDQITCARSGKQHTGPCAAAYRAAAVAGTPAGIIAVFGDPKSPIGVANNTFTCDVDASCPCRQKP